MKALVFTVLYQPLFNLLIFFVWVFGGNVAAAIIVLTVLVRFILLPSSIRATRVQQQLKALQPEIERLRAEHKSDPKAQNEALLSFYRTHKVNPFSSCLPLLLQMPFLIVLFYVFRNGLDTNHFSILYAFTPRPEALFTNFFGIDLAKPDLWVLPILTGAVQFIQSRQLQMGSKTEKPKAGDMQHMLSMQMMYIFPLLTVIIARSLPAALPLYWFVTTVFMIIQQKLIVRSTPPAAAVSVTVRKKDGTH